MVNLRSTSVKVALLWVALCQWAAAAELKIVGPASVPVGGVAFFKLEGVTAGDPFDYFSADGTLVVLFDVQTTPIGVVNGTKQGSTTLIGVKYDAESKKIQRVLLTVPIGAGPTPVPPTPVPPDPTPPTPPTPVVEGKRALLIIRESADSTPAVARMITNLRNPPNSDYLKSKGHTLAVLDDDSVDADGKPSAIVEAWRPQFAGMTLPVLFVIDPNGNKLVAKQSISATATADEVMKILKANGG